MPPIDYPGARMRLYLVRELHREALPGMIGSGWALGTFLGVYRDHTPEHAILTAREDHPPSFAKGPVMCTDMSAWCRLVSSEVAAAVWLVLFPDGTMERGAMGPGSPLVQAAQRRMPLAQSA